MNLITHALIGWTSAQTFQLTRRDLALLTVVSVAPDLDGLGIVADALSGDVGPGPSYFESWHHVLGHNILAGIVMTFLAGMLARNKRAVAIGAFGLFHLHLFCDLIGSRGPEGELWTISYLFPFSTQWTFAWQGQWEINAWPNMVLTILLLALAFRQARNQGFSPIWYLSARADEAFVETLRQRFPLIPRKL